MTKAVFIKEYGGPEVLIYGNVNVPKPSNGEALVIQTAIGLNYIDIYQRTGLYPLPALPTILGLEGCGIVEAVADDISYLKPGDRVVYAGGPIGAYSEARVIPAHRLVRLPDVITDKQAAAMMLKGLTVNYLLNNLRQLKAGETILLHAAAGGVGLIAIQWAKYLGATIIGTVSNNCKASLAKSLGADHIIDYSKENFVNRVREITNGKGVNAVYDSIGKDTFLSSLDCLAPRGMMVSFGQSSGPFGAVDIGSLLAKGSFFLTRPSLAHYTPDRQELLQGAERLFNLVINGKIKIEINQTYPLSEATQAHHDLEARKTTGSTILTI